MRFARLLVPSLATAGSALVAASVLPTGSTVAGGSVVADHWTNDRAAIARAAAANGPATDRVFAPEAAPPTDLTAARRLANDPPHVDPAAFNLAAYQAALRLPATRGAWRQVSPLNGWAEDPSTGASADGRLPGTGITLAIAADPRDRSGRTVYVGTGGGLEKTTDAGAHWTSPAGLPALPVGAVGVDPRDPRTVYAVTGQAFQGGGEGGGLGVFVSHDAGRSFGRPTRNVRGNGGQAVSVSPSGVAFVATSGGLFRSTDRGRSWTDVRLPTNAGGTAPATGTPVGSWTSDVLVRPGHPHEVYAAVGYVAGQVKTPDGTNAAPGNGLYRSTADGAPGTWRRVDVSSPVTGWKSSPGISNDPIGRTKLAFSPDGAALWALVADAGNRSARTVNDTALPLGAGHDTSLNGLYRTTALAPETTPSWDLKANSATLTAALGGSQPVLSVANRLGYDAGIQAWYNGWLAVNPANPDQVLVGEEEIYASTTPASAPGPLGFDVIDRYLSPCALGYPTTPVACPAGTPIYGGFSTHPDQHAGLPVPTSSGVRLWVGNDGGTYRQDSHPTTDAAGFDNSSWTTAAHYNTTLPYRAVMGRNGRVIAGLQDNGTVRIDPGGGPGIEICGGDGSGVAIARSNPDVFYCQANGAISVTTDGGKTTNSVNAPDSPAFLPAAFWMDPTNDDELTTGGSSVDQSVKGPASQSGDWVSVFTPPTVNGSAPSMTTVTTYGAAGYASFSSFPASSVKAPESRTDRELATNIARGCTPAAGSSACWHMAALRGMPVREIQGLAINPRDTRQLLIATSIASVVRYDFGGVNAARVLLSSDAGESVHDVSGNLPKGNYWDAKVIDGRAYVAGDFGVFTAPLGSTRWSRVGNLPLTRVFGIDRSADGKQLVAATYGRGVWTVPLASLRPTTATGAAQHQARRHARRRLPRTGGVSRGFAVPPSALQLAGTGLLAAAGAVRRRRRRA